MSKIQDALGKIQGRRESDRKEPVGSSSDSMILAQLVDNGSASQGDGRYNDKCLHVDSDALRDAGLMAPEYHEELLADQYREIKRPLIAHAFGKRATKVESGNLIMVTSAVSGEGKTFTSINLALSMAKERDHSVVLVDADVAKPHTSDMFGAADEPGLLDFLENDSLPLRSLIIPTDVENLSILPAGAPRPHATELLASAAMSTFCQAMSGLTDSQLVVFDTPPILQTSEAKVLTGFAGQVVVVVRAEETSQDAVAAAVSTLDEDKAVSLVLNQMRSKARDYQYGYGYGYGYGSRSGPESRADAPG